MNLSSQTISEIAKVLLQKDPELNRKKDASGNTPLHYAAAYDDLEMVTCILDKDEDVVTYKLNKDGHSPLHVAAGCGGVDIVKALVERCPGCVMLKDNKRRNPLHIAVEAGRRNVVEHILKDSQFGGLMSDRDCDGNTPLHLATIKGDHCMALLLVSMMPNMGINPVNNEGLTPHDILYPKRKTRIDSLIRRIILRCLGGEVGPIQYAFIRAGGMHGPRLCHLTNILKRSSGGKSCDKEDGRDDRIKGSTNSLLVMATLIIAVTFTAIITMPGGFESDTKPANSYGGTAVLTKRASFQAFVILDTLAFIFAFIAAGRLIWTSAWKGLELKINMLQNVNLMHAALMAMTLAFGTGAYSVLTRHCPWLGIVTLIGGSIIAYIPSVNLLLLMPCYYEKKKKITRALDWARNQSKLKKKRVVL
ncbi:hypothetical protein QJS04_geneDACA019103 [Acorus gramineus]|uniref:PGG domain-containing protein n=1 Tax=Acorus gramineus TaxID=55184 RepID=A0AAV9A8M9_ACOGR|nr:hypothetical protein QJS04_geneDACA019103 [Acorus gramineus]